MTYLRFNMTFLRSNYDVFAVYYDINLSRLIFYYIMTLAFLVIFNRIFIIVRHE